MFFKYQINTKKKRLAFEVILFAFTLLICLTIFFIGDYSDNYRRDIHYKKNEEIENNIKVLKDNTFRVRYEYLESNQRIKDYSYNSYKKNILNDKDSSYRRMIYYRLCDLYTNYRNDKTFDEFVNQFEYDSINIIDEKIYQLEEKKELLSQQRQENELSNNWEDFHITLIIILLITFYPLRLIYYTIRWSFNTLKDTEISSQNKKTDDLKKNNEIEEILNPEIEVSFENKVDTNDLEKKTQTEENKKPNIKNYFKFNNEYITGFSYLNRMLVSVFTSIIFGLGILLMLGTIYKRSKSLGYTKTLSIINCIIIPISFILNVTISETERKFGVSDDILMTIVPLVLLIPHMILLFKNGTRKKMGKFQIRT